MHRELQTTVEDILKTKDPVTTIRELIIAEKGFWNAKEVADPRKIVTLQVLGVQGIGLGVSAAVDNWL